MQNSFVVLWTLDRFAWLKRVKDRGPLEVIFGGPHVSLPNIGAIAIGDTVYPVAVKGGSLHLIGGMIVEAVTTAEAYVRDRHGFVLPRTGMWDEAFEEIKRTNPSFGHRFPWTCCDDAATGRHGTEIRFDRRIPGEMLGSIALGPKVGREQPLKNVIENKITSSASLQGHVRRLSKQSAELFAKQMALG
jgi:hypothetical protein